MNQDKNTNLYEPLIWKISDVMLNEWDVGTDQTPPI